MRANERVRFGLLGRHERGTGLLSPEDPDFVKDERNLDYLIATAVAPQPEVKRRWSEGPQLDQGREGACIGFGFTADILAAPAAQRDISSDLAHRYARHHWMRAQWLSTGRPVDPDRGATMNNGATVAKQYGLIDGYLWAQNIEDVRNAVIAEGPVVMATKMFDGVATPTWQGVIQPNRSNKEYTSSHCMCITGYDPARKAKVRGRTGTYRMFFIRNSWGKGWGERMVFYRKRNRRGKMVRRFRIVPTGGAWITYEDLDYLLTEYGWGWSAVLPVGRNPVNIEKVLAEHPDPYEQGLS